MKLRLTRRALLAAAGAAALDACAKGQPIARRATSTPAGCRPPSEDDAGASEDDAGASDRDEEISGAPPDAQNEAVLVPDPAGLFDLRAGYSYRIVQRRGDPMSDGYRVPGRPDAMACFAGEDGSILVMRNHEIRDDANEGTPYFPDQAPPPEAYEAGAFGGVTRMVLDPDTLELRSSNLVLAGTSWNCAGGVSPFGWLSCEEVTRAGHGYVFACDPQASRVQPFDRIPAYGRCRHEAATVDAATMIAYLTEDQQDACFYRFVPHTPDRPFEGVLQALRVRGHDRFDTGRLPAGQRLEVEWVDLDDPDPVNDTLRLEAQAKGAAVFRRTEGLWLAEGELFMSATTGGQLGYGQILRLGLTREPGLETLVESCDPAELANPDNLTVSPHGALYVVEDTVGHCHLRRVLRDGTLEVLGRNPQPGRELAGPCFSPDGRTLLVNLQNEGITLAIRGPFDADLEASGSSAALRSPSRAGFARMAAAAWRGRTLA